MLRARYHCGFTLIELLLVIGVIGILASVVIVAINPSKQLADAEDAQRRADIKAILDAVYQFNIKEWRFPQRNGIDQITSTPTEVCNASVGLSSFCVLFPGFEKVYLGELLVDDYLADIPIDPDHNSSANAAATYGTSYFISIDTNGRITVSAPLGDDGNTISVTR